MNDLDAVTKEENGGLLFAWRKKPALFISLAAFIGGSLILHLVGFYLFQVVYPAAGRLEPEPARVTLLDVSQPAVNALLRKVEDRLVYLRPASDSSEVRVSLGDYSVQFESSISSRVPAFKSTAPVAAIQGSHARAIADPLAPLHQEMPNRVLPPVEATVDPDPNPERATESEDRWRVTGDLAGRPLVDAEVLVAELPVLGVPPAIRFQIAVGPNGALVTCLPVSGQDHPQFESVFEVIRNTLRFEPKPGAELEWGRVEIRR